MDTRIFEKFASSLTVDSICTPLLCEVAPADITLAQFNEPNFDAEPDKSGLDPRDHPMRVVDDDDKVIGILWPYDCVEFDEDNDQAYETTLRNVMQPIAPSQLVTSDTSILELVALFADKSTDIYYVLHRNEVTGPIGHDDVFKPIGRLVFLTLALEIEDHALRLCQSNSVRKRCWTAISEARRHKAIELFEKRHGRLPRSKRARFERLH